MSFPYEPTAPQPPGYPHQEQPQYFPPSGQQYPPPAPSPYWQVPQQPWPPQQTPPSPPRNDKTALYLAIAALIIVALALAWRFNLGNAQGIIGGAPTATATTTAGSATATPPANHILYRADWSNDLNGWQEDLPSDGNLSVANGALQSGYNTCCALVAPFHPPSADYAVQATMTMIACPANGSSFGVFGRGSPTSSGAGGLASYVAYLGTTNNLRLRVAPNRDGSAWQTLVEKPHPIDTATHTFRLEFQGTQLRFFFDGALVAATDDATYPQGAYVGVEDAGCQVIVTAFQVDAIGSA